MSSSVRVLIAEDESKFFEVLKRVLEKNNWIVDGAKNGEDALKMLKESSYQVLLTDLNMSKMNGMELISHVRNEVTQKPLLIMVTAFSDPAIKTRALQLEIDGFFTRTMHVKNLFACIFKGIKRLKKDERKRASLKVIHTSKDPDSIHPPFVGVVIAVSTGGPQTLQKLFANLTPPFNSSLLMVQHGPGWVLGPLAESLDNDYEFQVQLATDGMKPRVDRVYLAPGDRHLCINPETFCFELSDDPPEHFLRPAADPLFRSGARAFGKYCVGVVLSGLGNDGAMGVKKICDFGGKVLIQDPKTAVAKAMPQAAINSGVEHQVVPLRLMAQTILKKTSILSQQLHSNAVAI